MNLVDIINKEKSNLFKKVKYKVLPYVFAGVIALGGVSCGGNNPPKPKEKVTVVLNNESMQKLSSYEDDKLYFTESTNQLDLLKTGDIIVGSPNNTTPYGFLRRITDIQTDNLNTIYLGVEGSTTGTTIKTEFCSLEEAIEEGTVEESKLKQKTFNIGIPLIDEVLYDKDKNPLTTDDQIRATGNISLDLNLDFDLTFEKHKLTELLYTKSLTGKLNFDLTSSVDVDNLYEKIPILSNNLGTYSVVVGGIPIWLTPKLKVNVGVKGDIPKDLSANVTGDANLIAGLSYYYGDWDIINGSSSSFNFGLDVPKVNTTGNPPKAFAGVELDLLVYSVVGPYGELNGYSKIEINHNEENCWKIYGGLEAILGLKMDICGFGKEFPATSIDIYSELLDEGSEGCIIPLNKIAFVSDRDGNDEIYVMNPDGSEQTNLTNNSSYDLMLKWSPDGSKIAFESGRDGNSEIYVMNADGSEQTNLTNNPAKDNSPNWSPKQ